MRQFIPVNKPLSALRNIQHKTQPSLVLVIYSKFLFLYTPSRVMPQPHYVSTKLLPQCDGMLYFGFQSCMVEPGTLCVATNNFSFSSKFSGCAHTNFFLFFFLSFNTSPVQGRAHMSEDKIGMRCHLPFARGRKGVLQSMVHVYHSSGCLIELRHNKPLVISLITVGQDKTGMRCSLLFGPGIRA